MNRGSGVLMPISSLPGAHGIGSLGKEAFAFVDFLEKSAQKYWQILPIGPTGYGDSPYQSFSAFAFNPYFIDLDLLCADKLLSAKDIKKYDFGEHDLVIDYYKLYKSRDLVLKKAVGRFDKNDKGFKKFLKENVFWINDYALFMALKKENNDVSFTCWGDDIRLQNKKAMAAAKTRLAGEIEFYCVVQYLFYRQWTALKRYANKKGISIIGDIPIYVSPDSSELWAQPELFQLDKNRMPTEVAGCPPDGFSADGQLWGNPLYDWDYHAATEFSWWIMRIKYACDIYDVVRIDHFRGFEGYYAIPAGDDTARNGRWKMGPGLSFINAVNDALPQAPIIAEDLGFLTKGVYEMLRYSGYPGMKVLQFAFDSRDESDYLPHNYPKNCIVYTGTHDNTTTEDWKTSAPKEDVKFCKKYLGLSKKDENFTRTFIRCAMASVSNVCITPFADWINLGIEGRINTPSTLGGNWCWRADKASFTKDLSGEIAQMTRLYGRADRNAKHSHSTINKK